jgi:hypothetical protein
VRRKPEPALPLSGADSFTRARRRTFALRVVLGVAAMALLGLAVWSATFADAPTESALPQGRSGVVVVDLSRSIGPKPEALLLDAFRRLDAPDGRLGLVVFSDVAYELLPPGSPGSELKPIERYFEPTGRVDEDGDAEFPDTPWDESFRGGTRISTGLVTAWEALKRAGIRNGSILLVSDLATEPDDVQKVADLGIAMERHNVEVRILGLAPRADDRALFARIFGDDVFLAQAQPVGVAGLAHRVETRLTAPLPWALIGAALLLLAALAANEMLCGRLVLPARGSA